MVHSGGGHQNGVLPLVCGVLSRQGRVLRVSSDGFVKRPRLTPLVLRLWYEPLEMLHSELPEERQEMIARCDTVPLCTFTGCLGITFPDRIDDGLMLFN